MCDISTGIPSIAVSRRACQLTYVCDHGAACSGSTRLTGRCSMAARLTSLGSAWGGICMIAAAFDAGVP